MTFMSKMGQFGGTQVIEVIARLLQSADQSMKLAQTTEVATAPFPAPPGNDDRMLQTGEPAGIRMVHDMLLGEIMVRRGMILSEHINEALHVARESGLQFGEALLKIGAATWPQIEDALQYQDSCRQLVEGVSERRQQNNAPRPATKLKFKISADSELQNGLRLVSDALLGDVLMKNKAITQEQLDLGLQNQRATGLRIGEALVNLGFCDWRDVDYAIQVQGQMRRYAS